MITINDIQIFIMTHNRKKYLEQTINCFLSQSLEVNEIIILDNQSTDGTEEFIKSLNNPCIKYIRTCGFLGNYYKAGEIANKKYCMLFHDDDILHPDYLKYAVKILNKYDDISLITCKHMEFFDDDTPKNFAKVSDNYHLFNSQLEFTRYMYYVEGIAYAPAIYRTKDFKNEDLEFEKFNKFNDWTITLKMAKYGKTIYFDDNRLMLTRIHRNQDTWTQENILSDMQAINWVKFFYDILQPNTENDDCNYLDAKAIHFLKNRYENFVDNKIKREMTFEEYMNKARSIINFKNDIDYMSILKSQKYSKFRQKIHVANLKHKVLYNITNSLKCFWKNIKKQKYDKKYWIKYFKKNNEQKYIDKLAEELNGKKVLIYGYGIIGQLLFQEYDLSKLNIVAVADIKFKDGNGSKLSGYNTIAPNDMNNADFDVILSSLKSNCPLFLLGNYLNINKKIISLIVGTKYQ